jgi:biofilm protein TabA
MIIDSIDNILMYEPIAKGLKVGVQTMSEMTSLQEGRYEFEGGFFTVQSGETKSLNEGSFEAHRKYIDVQILLEGCEELAWSDICNLETMIPYHAETDIERLDGKKDHHILISKGMFYIVFPHDGHKAVSHTEEKHKFKKIVMKLLAAV